ncbi:TerC/Alx family metal homeostasis membrane protein [Clostridium cylindrosporum]|uniref:Inner membrane protein Alx n=1 Tax=Clostridium cylindrosporum DSM 605 TaxID=1121307 RepID=A0A0J8D9X4_CLOCY|nr:TerC/Alx family metal homeostasis membrane protein [Clostridium cylindrosporum]KMT22855.1 inner membrane protein Alx [Clostridium cylindrosporum DSM 605]
METRKAIKWVVFWVSLSLVFNLGIYFFMGMDKALEYLGGYVIEETLSLDNLFLFLIIFENFNIPSNYQRRVLNFGIIGAIILRFIFVVFGVSVVSEFGWVLYIFGFILIISGVKMLRDKEEVNRDYSKSIFIKLIGKIVPISNRLHGEKFFFRKNNILYATPLFAILFLIEGSDVLFAIDSIPAIFSITTDPFIVYTSNIFAMLGLRSLYFVLSNMNNQFRYVKQGVALILVFTGIKLSVLLFGIHISIVVSLMVIFTLLIGSVVMSILANKREKIREGMIKNDIIS